MASNNGERELDEIAEAENLEHNPDGFSEGDIKAILDKSSLEGTFSTPVNPDTIRLLLTPGSKVMELCMRGDVPDRQFAVALASLWAKYSRRNYTEGKIEILVLLSALVGISGARAKLAVEGITGQRNNDSNMSNGDKFKKWAERM